MSKHVLLATEKPFSQAARDRTAQILRGAGYKVSILEKYPNRETLLKAVVDVDAIIVRSDKIDKEVLDAAPNLKLVVRAGAGYDNVDCNHARSREVAVMNTPGQNSNAVAELAFGLMLYMARGQFNGKTGSELLEKRLGIHALGAVGRRVAAIAKGFGMEVQAYDPFLTKEQIQDLGAKPVESMEELYRTSDYLSLHLPSNAQTKQSIGRELLGLMPQGACLVNTARAEVIHEEQLRQLMEERADLRYATDVAPADPVWESIKGQLGNRFYSTPKKMGAQTEEANSNAGAAAARQIVAFLEKGDQTFVVNK